MRLKKWTAGENFLTFFSSAVPPGLSFAVAWNCRAPGSSQSASASCAPSVSSTTIPEWEHAAIALNSPLPAFAWKKKQFLICKAKQGVPCFRRSDWL